MVKLPPELVATKFPGYFWNPKKKKLYSIKVHGELRELTHTASRWVPGVGMLIPGYRVSVRGQRRTLADDYLETLTYEVQDSEVGYYAP